MAAAGESKEKNGEKQFTEKKKGDLVDVKCEKEMCNEEGDLPLQGVKQPHAGHNLHQQGLLTELDMPNKDYLATMETMNSSHGFKAPSTMYDPWSFLVDNTTLHGVRYILRKRFPALRLLWLLMVLTAGSYCTFLVYKAITRYLTYPVSTVLEHKYPTSMKFPAVTICPQNMFEKSKILMSDSDPEFEKLGLNMSVCKATSSVRAGRPCGQAMLCCCGLLLREELVFSTVPNCSREYKSQLKQALNRSNIVLNTREFYRIYGPDMEHLLAPFCTFNFIRGDNCTVQDFSSLRITESGKCFTFNSGQSQKIGSVVDAGVTTGLNVVLDSQVEEYTTSKLSQGFQIFVHEQHEFIDTLSGTLVGPGTHVAIAVLKQKFVNLPSPYSTKCKNKKSNMFPFYTIQGCRYECELKKVEEDCGCHLLSYQGTMNVEKCDCPVPCESVQYNTQVSYSTGFPDPWSSALLKGGGYNQTLEYQRTNLAFVQVGFKSLSYENQEQGAAFDKWALLGEIGGHMGLFIGCSFITLCEFVDCLLIFLFQKFRK